MINLEQSRAFLEALRGHNEKPWFDAHRGDYEELFKKPGEALTKELANRVSALCGRPLQGKLFRLFRDVRFSADKTPYHSHLHIGLQGDGPGAFFFGLDPDKLTFGAGCMVLKKNDLSAYRHTVLKAERGEALQALLEQARAKGFRQNEPELKRIPQGFDKEHPRADLLRFKSLTLWHDLGRKNITSIDAKGDLLERSLEVFEDLLPLDRWLLQMT